MGSLFRNYRRNTLYELYKSGDYATALKNAKRLASKDPVYAAEIASESLKKLHRLDEALAEAEKMEKHSQGEVTLAAKKMQARLLWDLRRFSEARAIFDRVVQEHLMSGVNLAADFLFSNVFEELNTDETELPGGFGASLPGRVIETEEKPPVPPDGPAMHRLISHHEDMKFTVDIHIYNPAITQTLEILSELDVKEVLVREAGCTLGAKNFGTNVRSLSGCGDLDFATNFNDGYIAGRVLLNLSKGTMAKAHVRVPQPKAAHPEVFGFLRSIRVV